MASETTTALQTDHRGSSDPQCTMTTTTIVEWNSLTVLEESTKDTSMDLSSQGTERRIDTMKNSTDPSTTSLQEISDEAWLEAELPHCKTDLNQDHLNNLTQEITSPREEEQEEEELEGPELLQLLNTTRRVEEKARSSLREE